MTLIRPPTLTCTSIGSLAILLISCGLPNESGKSGLQGEVPSTHTDTATLGQAFHSGKAKMLNVDCVTGDVTEELGNVSGAFNLKLDLGFDDLIDRLSGNLAVGVNFPTVRAGASARYATDNTATANSSTYNFLWRATPKKRTLKRPTSGQFMLSEYGLSVAKDLNTSMEKCGDEFVSSIEYGATLNVTMKMEFRNEQDKRDIGGKLKVDVLQGTVNVDGNLDYLSQEVKKSVKITVEATQQGGRPLEILKIIPDNLVSCSLDNPSVCFNVFSQAIKYAKGDLPQQFTSLDSYNVIKYTTQKYAESGVDKLTPSAGYPTVNVLVEEARENLDHLFQDALVDRARARKLISSYSEWLTDDLNQKLVDLEAKANSNANRLSSAAVFCYDNPYNGCLEREADVKKQLSSYDKSLLSIKVPPIAAIERCENARLAAVRAGVVSERWSQAYRKQGKAPVFFNNANPEEGINVWGPCEEAVSYYGDYFKN